MDQHTVGQKNYSTTLISKPILKSSPSASLFNTPPPTPTPTFTTVYKTDNRKDQLVDCVGPDGKHSQQTTTDCDTFNKAWGNSDNLILGNVRKLGRCLSANELKTKISNINPAYVYEKPNDPCGYYLPPKTPVPTPVYLNGFGINGGIHLDNHGDYLYGTDRDGNRVFLYNNSSGGGYYGRDAYGNQINLYPNSFGGLSGRSTYGNSFQIDSNQIYDYTSY